MEFNHWGTARGQITEEQLYAEIDLAAELGAELFMLDAGWFGDVGRWNELVGDYNQESPLLTKGVRAALDRVRQKGVRAGLWVEPERVGLKSKSLAEHPEWLMRRRGEVIPNLDLSRPEVAEYVEKILIGIIDRYELDLVKIDYNHSIGEGGEADRGGYSENVLWRYYDALYRIFDSIRVRYPNLLLESCASGGGRADLGMLSRFHWASVTDQWSPGPTARIINGATIMLPPELCSTFVGGASDGVSDIDFLIRLGMFTQINVSGIFPTLDELNLATWERWRHGIELYKSFCRPLLPTARMFHHTPIQRQTEPGEWIVFSIRSGRTRTNSRYLLGDGHSIDDGLCHRGARSDAAWRGRPASAFSRQAASWRCDGPSRCCSRGIWDPGTSANQRIVPQRPCCFGSYWRAPPTPCCTCWQSPIGLASH